MYIALNHLKNMVLRNKAIAQVLSNENQQLLKTILE